jgi:hypothetical protein
LFTVKRLDVSGSISSQLAAKFTYIRWFASHSLETNEER